MFLFLYNIISFFYYNFFIFLIIKIFYLNSILCIKIKRIQQLFDNSLERASACVLVDICIRKLEKISFYCRRNNGTRMAKASYDHYIISCRKEGCVSYHGLNTGNCRHGNRQQHLYHGVHISVRSSKLTNWFRGWMDTETHTVR